MLGFPAFTPTLTAPEQQITNKQNVLMISNLEKLCRNEAKIFERLCPASDTCFHFVILIDKDEFTGSLEKVYRKLFDNGIPSYSMLLSFENVENSKNFISNYIVKNDIDFTISFTNSFPIENGIEVE